MLVSGLSDLLSTVPDGLPQDPELMRLIEELSGALEEGDADGAVALVDRMVERWPCYAWVYVMAAIARRRAGQLQAARADLAVALGLAPGDASVFRQLAYTLKQEGNAHAAAEVLAQGWRAYERLTGRKTTPDEREAYFRLLA